MGIYQKEGEFTFAQIERKIPVRRPKLPSNQSSFCGLRSSRERRERGTDGQIVTIKTAADRRQERRREIVDEERE